jgi:hypothetical protein
MPYWAGEIRWQLMLPTLARQTRQRLTAIIQ